MKSRECDNFDKLVDLIVADRLKDSLSGPCLKYCLSLEGSKVLSSQSWRYWLTPLMLIILQMVNTGATRSCPQEKMGLIAILPNLSSDLHRVVPLRHLMWGGVTAPLQPESLRVILTTAIMVTGQV